MMVLRHISTGERQIVGSLDGIDPKVWSESGEPVPNDLEGTAYQFHDDVGPVPVPRRLNYGQVVALYTPAEVGRIFSCTEAAVTRLLLALRYFGVELGGVTHSQGTALIAGLGLLDGPERVARILAGEPPL